MQFDVFYKIQKGTLLGGKYGTKLAFNYSKDKFIEWRTVFKNDKENINLCLLVS